MVRWGGKFGLPDIILAYKLIRRGGPNFGRVNGTVGLMCSPLNLLSPLALEEVNPTVPTYVGLHKMS